MRRWLVLLIPVVMLSAGCFSTDTDRYANVEDAYCHDGYFCFTLDRELATSYKVEYKWRLYHPGIGESLFSGRGSYRFLDSPNDSMTRGGSDEEEEGAVRIELIWTYYQGPVFLRCVNLSVRECFDNDDWHDMQMYVDLYDGDERMHEYSGHKPESRWDYSTQPPSEKLKSLPL